METLVVDRNPWRGWRWSLTTLLALGSVLLLWAYGPIHQLPHYHDFVGDRAWWGVPAAVNVWSNLPFLLVGLWGLRVVGRLPRVPGDTAWAGWRLFFLGVTLTGAGSAFYHWAPDNARLVWDRLPIALAAAGMLAAGWAEGGHRAWGREAAALCALLAVISVAWWHFTGLGTAEGGDLRPYLWLQLAPLLLVPCWQHRAQAPWSERLAILQAGLCYGLAKVAELGDAVVYDLSGGWLSGHHLKHLLAALACAWLAAMLRQRSPAQPAMPQRPKRVAHSST
ncbi:alkaline phytoceramidase [Chitiniphilus eburneus]|uniref:Alkaline phytoceramidase n=1 Tax=Chitiniphilus eburneus TaxID=2571148 RepID=A0A4U0PIW6_9NEIS|nr:alkaline phytoceramidase [Chitiniphilus eburneus]TJZ67976.1 alkaline phytoceramidase [Chitiniphilus eburneus]